jgi:hypothetical protein
MYPNTASQNQLLSLAQQGDAASLTALINHNLFPLGVTVMTTLQDKCLVVTAVLPQNIDRLFLINFMREGMERLQAKSIQQVLLIGKDRERITPDWQYILNLHQADLPPVVPLRQPQLPLQPPPPAIPQPIHQQLPRHPLASTPLRWLLLLTTCGLLVGGTWAAKTVFLVENAPDNYSTPAASNQSLP